MLPFDPKKPLFGFTARAPHAKRRLHLFADGSGVFFRPRRAPADWWGGFAEDQGYVRGALNNRVWGEVTRELSSLVHKGEFYRAFDLPDPRQEQRMWRIWWHPDEAWVEPVVQQTDCNGAFFKPRPSQPHLWNTPTAALLEQFSIEWNDDASDVRAALPWCDLSFEERQARAIRWERGNWKLLREVIEAALRVAPGKNEPAKFARYVSASWFGQESLKLASPWTKFDSDAALIPPLLSVLEMQFRSYYNLPEGARNNWNFPWDEKDENRGTQIWLEVAPPTAHERLEAALFLRDWLSQNAPDLLNDWFPDAS